MDSNACVFCIPTRRQPIGIEDDASLAGGMDTVNNALQLQSGHYQVEAPLLTKSILSFYVAESVKFDTPEYKSFAPFYSKSSLAPEIFSLANSNLIVP